MGWVILVGWLLFCLILTIWLRLRAERHQFWDALMDAPRSNWTLFGILFLLTGGVFAFVLWVFGDKKRYYCERRVLKFYHCDWNSMGKEAEIVGLMKKLRREMDQTAASCRLSLSKNSTRYPQDYAQFAIARKEYEKAELDLVRLDETRWRKARVAAGDAPR